MSDEVALQKFTIVNARGLHARAATKLVLLAGKFPCEIVLIGADGQEANAKSVMGVLLLCGAAGTTLEVKARGDQAGIAVRSIGELIESRFGEPD